MNQLTTKTYNVKGMTCSACERHIEHALSALPGVESVRARFGSGSVELQWDESQTSEATIESVLADEGYPVAGEMSKTERIRQWAIAAGIIAVIGTVYFVLKNAGVFNQFPIATPSTALPMLFVIGLATSIHCIAMCGGINISQAGQTGACAAPSVRRKLMPSLLYNIGRVVSYTVIGGIVGAIGSSVTPTGGFKGTVSIVAAGFMVVMGLSMLNIIPGVAKIAPRMPRFLGRFIDQQKTGKGPFVVGLLNGLMPCGPLQAMQLYALSTGSALLGAASMFMFSAGTVPLMFGLGALSSLLSARFSSVMTKVSAVLVIVLGVIMLNAGLVLSGISPLF